MEKYTNRATPEIIPENMVSSGGHDIFFDDLKDWEKEEKRLQEKERKESSDLRAEAYLYGHSSNIANRRHNNAEKISAEKSGPVIIVKPGIVERDIAA